MSENPESTEPLAAGITDDLPCRRCGHNLRSLRADGSCPECGLAVKMSMPYDRLELANPYWLGKVHVGLWLVLASVVARQVGAWSGTFSPSSHSTIGSAFNETAPILLIVGYWVISWPEPGQIGFTSQFAFRKILRFLLVLQLTLLISDYGLGWLGLHRSTIYCTLLTIEHIVFVIGAFVQLTYLLLLVSRTPDETCIQWTWRLRIGYVLAIAAYSAFQLWFTWWRLINRSALLAPKIMMITYIPIMCAEIAADVALFCALVRIIGLVRRAEKTALSRWA